MNDASRLLAEQHMGYALSLAGRYSQRASALDVDQLEGAALEGLCQAAQTYNSARGVPFKSWAARRIIGAMRDDLRSTDHLSRSTRTKVKLKETKEGMIDARYLPPTSLDSAMANGFMYDGYSRFADPTAEEAFAKLFPRVTSEEVDYLLEMLPSRERLVILLRYFEDMRLWQIADVLLMSESRASQFEAKALQRMRFYLLQLWGGTGNEEHKLIPVAEEEMAHGFAA